MHKYTHRVLGTLTIIAFISPIVVSAQSIDTNGQIQSLMTQIAALQQQLKTIMQAAQTSSGQSGGRSSTVLSGPFDNSLHHAGLSTKPQRKSLPHNVGTGALGRPRRDVDLPALHVLEDAMVLSGRAVAARQKGRLAPVEVGIE